MSTSNKVSGYYKKTKKNTEEGHFSKATQGGRKKAAGKVAEEAQVVLGPKIEEKAF